MNLREDYKKNYSMKPYIMDIRYILTLSLEHTGALFLSSSVPATALF